MLWPLFAAVALASPVDEACRALGAGVPADSRVEGTVIVVDKDLRRLALLVDGEFSDDRCWPVALAPGAAPGPKRQRGDLKTPEGWYRTSDKPWSSFDHAIAVHYPNAADAGVGVALGLIDTDKQAAIAAASRKWRVPDQNTRMGGQILIHGGGAAADWTLGCIAMNDADLLSLRSQLPAGMRTWVHIAP